MYYKALLFLELCPHVKNRLKIKKERCTMVQKGFLVFQNSKFHLDSEFFIAIKDCKILMKNYVQLKMQTPSQYHLRWRTSSNWKRRFIFACNGNFKSRDNLCKKEVCNISLIVDTLIYIRYLCTVWPKIRQTNFVIIVSVLRKKGYFLMYFVYDINLPY